ncbi:MAG TPA: hypothetical protein VLA77_02180 [Candidatus Saccharimonadales bacterium]|nr:hypothetical protein [Candidatus Saccharimonadales bacterium]
MNRRRVALVGLLAIPLACLAFVLSNSVVMVTGPASVPVAIAPSPSVVPSPAVVPPDDYCLVKAPPEYLGEYTPDNDFGYPAVTDWERKHPKKFLQNPDSLPDTLTDLKIRWCGVDGEGVRGGDPLLQNAHFSVPDDSDPNRPFNEASWRATTDANVNRVKWDQAELKLAPAGDYYVMYMVESRKTGKLEVRISLQWKPDTLVLMLPIARADGTGTETLMLRLECGFQPMFEKRSSVPRWLQKFLN